MGPGPVTRDQAFDDPAAQMDLGLSTEAGMGEPVLSSTALLISCKSKLIHSETGAWEAAGWGPWMPTQKRSGRGKLESLGILSALIPSEKGPMGRAPGSLLPRELLVCVGGRRCLDQQ